MPRTLAGGAILGGGECCGSKIQSVHAGEKMEELYKTNHLVSTVNIMPYLAKLVFIGNDIIHALQYNRDSDKLIDLMTTLLRVFSATIFE